MSLHLIADTSSPYYASDAFGRLLDYVARNNRSCEFVQRTGRHIIRINNIPTVPMAISTLEYILSSRGKDEGTNLTNK